MSDHRRPRTCWDCGFSFPPPLAIGWTPRGGGWHCPSCSLAYNRRVDRLARKLLRSPSRAWLGSARDLKHGAREACLHCDVIRRAIELALGAPERR